MQTQCMLKVCLSKTGYPITNIPPNHFVYIIKYSKQLSRCTSENRWAFVWPACWHGGWLGRVTRKHHNKCVSHTINAFDCHTSTDTASEEQRFRTLQPHVTNTRRCAKTWNSAGVLCKSIHFLFLGANPSTPQKRPTSCHIETVHQSIMWWLCICDNDVWLWKNPRAVVALQECASGCTARVWRWGVSSRMFWKPLIIVKRI